jgi:hypothetical protein
MTDKATETERAALHGFIHVMTSAVNELSAFVPMPVLASALFSGAAEIVKSHVGAKSAAEILRRAVDEFERQNPGARH